MFRLEHIPLVVGAVVALVGLALLWDAWTADYVFVSRDRRRRPRTERNRGGEAFVGLGTLCLAAALFGRDTWRYQVIAVLAGTLLLIIGAIKNWSFIRELMSFRGASRRREVPGDTAPSSRASGSASPSPSSGDPPATGETPLPTRDRIR